MNIPRIVIAGTNSGCGKTTISMGIMAALCKRGYSVQPFKVGPDYIDPMFHTFITKRDSRNLDSWIFEGETIKHLFNKNANDADIAVVEGVMGFYDGYGGKSIEGSTAEVAHILKAPVILVINAGAMSLSAAAIVKGFVEFYEYSNVKGVILNNVSSSSHFSLLKEAIETHTNVRVVGYLKKNEELILKDRHLGLVTANEIDDLQRKVEILANEVEETIDLELLLDIANEASEINSDLLIEKVEEKPKVKIAVAMDKAFCFYYKDNLDLLIELGAELKFFSPLSDASLPKDIDGLYLGGGYPEVWAKELEDNYSMKLDIKEKIEAGLPTFAECGGFMYLTESIKNISNDEYRMVGVLKGNSTMTNSLKRFGYVNLETSEDNILSKIGMKIRAHEFHFSNTYIEEDIKPCFKISKGQKAIEWNCGFKIYNLLAGYPHIHFWSNTDFAKSFVDTCREYKKRWDS